MRELVLLRGAPGSGKSTWINNNHLSQYTLCADTIRCMFQTPVMNHEQGVLCITQKNDTKVWKLLFDLLEARMERGEFTIIDACHSKTSDFSKYYKLCEKYRYRMSCIDFSSVPIEVCKKQNKMREQYKWVPEQVLENIYSRFATNPIPNKITTYSPDNWSEILEFNPLDVSNYKKIVFFGDIHSCFDPLNKYFTANPFNMETLYVFCGDYFDRGIQHKEVCQWLLEHYSYKNVMLLQGNHEIHFMKYANNEVDEIRSEEFIKNTMLALESFSKKDLRQLARKFSQCAYLKYYDKIFLVTHAGLGFMPEKLKLIASNEMIRGGKYEDDIDKWFHNNNTNNNLIQIHGHRNMYKVEINQYVDSINLNEYVEFGENLRILEVSND